MVEAMLLLACVLVLMAVTVSLFAFAADASTSAQRLQEAADIAQNTVEEFVADPADIPEQQTVGDYVVMCEVDRNPTDAGTMYDARVTVLRGVDELCALTACKYEPASVRAAGASAAGGDGTADAGAEAGGTEAAGAGASAAGASSVPEVAHE